MNSTTEESSLALFLPEGILDYFEIIDHQTIDRKEKVYKKH